LIFRFLITIFIGTLFPSFCWGQSSNKLDSLKNVISISEQDTTKISTLIALSVEFKNRDLDSAAWYSDRALRIAQDTELPDYLAAAYVSLAEINVRRDSLNQAKASYLEAIKNYQLINAELKLPDLYLKLGSLCTYQNDEIQAMTYFQEALAISEKYNLKSKIEKTYNNLGSV